MNNSERLNRLIIVGLATVLGLWATYAGWSTSLENRGMQLLGLFGSNATSSARVVLVEYPEGGKSSDLYPLLNRLQSAKPRAFTLLPDKPWDTGIDWGAYSRMVEPLFHRQADGRIGQPEALPLPNLRADPGPVPLEWLRRAPNSSRFFYAVRDADAKLGLQPLYAPGEQLLSYPIAVSVGSHIYPSLALRLAAMVERLPMSELRFHPAAGLRIGSKTLPLTSDLRVQPPGYQTGAIPRLNATELLTPEADLSQITRGVVIVAPQRTQNSIVFHGSGGESVSAGEWTAQITAALLDGRLRSGPAWFHVVQRLLIIALALYLLLLPDRWLNRWGWIATAVLLALLANGGLIALLLKNSWLPVVWPGLFLLLLHGGLGLRQRVVGRLTRLERQDTELRARLAQQYQNQGQLEPAFNELMQGGLDRQLRQPLLELGLELERRRQFQRALVIYDRIHAIDPNYGDINLRRQKLQNGDGNSKPLRGQSAGATTIISSAPHIEKPMLGRYQVEHELGRGAMGVVYLGVDPKIGRKVAIKTLSFTDSFEGRELKEVQERFSREAQAVGRLDHPNVVTVYDVGEEHDLAYIAMDYLQGSGLEAFCHPDNLLPVEEVVEIGIQVADALDYAHENKVIHRDIKPANIIYESDSGQIKLTDFGIAHLADESATRTGAVLGSPSYMSPEQVAGHRVDGRTDIYSLGITLYQLLTGKLPFVGDSLPSLMYKITNGRPKSLKSQRPELAPCLGRIISKAIQRQADKRYQSGGAMALALSKCLEQL